MSREYSFREIATLSGADTGQLNNWSKKGLIVGDVQGRAGRGRHQVYSLYNGLEAAIATELAHLNATVAILSRILSYMRQLEALARATAARRTALLRKVEASLRAADPAIRAPLSATEKIFRKDLKTWIAFRNPRTREQFSFFGVAYWFVFNDPQGDAKRLGEGDAEGVAVRRNFVLIALTAIPKGKGIARLPGRANVVVDIAALLESLEKATGDTLID